MVASGAARNGSQAESGAGVGGEQRGDSLSFLLRRRIGRCSVAASLVIVRHNARGFAVTAFEAARMPHWGKGRAATRRERLRMRAWCMGRRVWAGPCTHRAIGTSDHQNDTVVVSVTSRGSPTATIRLLLLDG